MKRPTAPDHGHDTAGIISGSGTSSGIGFATPVDLVDRVVPQVTTRGRAPFPGIGIVPAPARAH
jgi:S1-C subfamily serine protease